LKSKLDFRTKLFISWSDSVERRLKQALWFLVVLLLLGQTAMQVPSIRSWLSETDKWEGIPFERQSP
jgi:hypothetical protein